jgi:hypothetical protein
MNEKIAYDIVVDSGKLTWQQAGPLFARYTVALRGSLDDRWAACYNRLAAASEQYTRFRLDLVAGSVSFTTRSSDAPAQVRAVVEKLQTLVDAVNLQANSELVPQS